MKNCVMFANNFVKYACTARTMGYTKASMAGLTEEQANSIELRASKVFVPRTAIRTRELFSGRRDQIMSVADAISQVGLHVVIFGERGVGKTSLANIIKPLLEIMDEDGSEKVGGNGRLVVRINCQTEDRFSDSWIRAFEEAAIRNPSGPFGFVRSDSDDRVPIANLLDASSEITIDMVRRVLGQFQGCVFIFDEFDRVSYENASPFTDLIKALSDFAVDATVILVGVADTVDTLVGDHDSIKRAIIQVHMPRMTPAELRDILKNGEKELGISFTDSAAERIIRISQGLPHYTHLLGQHAVRSACKSLDAEVSSSHVQTACIVAVRDAQQAILSKFAAATRSAHKDALYTQVLLACAITASRAIDELGFFQASSVVEPLRRIVPPERNVDVSTFNKHLVDFCGEKRGPVLERTGSERNYRYRFRDPLLPPYAIMHGLSKGILNSSIIDQLVATSGGDSVANGQMKLF